MNNQPKREQFIALAKYAIKLGIVVGRKHQVQTLANFISKFIGFSYIEFLKIVFLAEA